MRRKYLISFAGFSLCAILCWPVLGQGGGQSSKAENDLVRLSESWWGTSIQEFPKKAGLKQGEYSIGNHPSRAEIMVLVPNSSARWVPVELPVLSFDFTVAGGLQEISGFYKGSQEQVLAVLVKRYGRPDQGTQALGMRAYGWEFDRTYLDLRDGIFQLLPKK